MRRTSICRRRPHDRTLRSPGERLWILAGRTLAVALTCSTLLTSAPLPATAVGAASTAQPRGVWPLLPPAVKRRFDPPNGPYAAGHRGVDLAGVPGQPVRAALAGTISFSGQLAGRGVVVVDHGDTRTTYEPVVAGPAVGTAVSAGQVIGRLSPVGSHCAPVSCLHWGWLRQRTYLDPLALVGALPVRLLPLTGAQAVRASVDFPSYSSGASRGLAAPARVFAARPSVCAAAGCPTTSRTYCGDHARGWACW